VFIGRLDVNTAVMTLSGSRVASQHLNLDRVKLLHGYLSDLRITLHYLGVPIRDKSYMFGDNKSVVDNSMQVNAKLHKRHTILSFHCVRECIASTVVGFYSIHGESNTAETIIKHWGNSKFSTRLKVKGIVVVDGRYT
jgi:hypothetical protein